MEENLSPDWAKTPKSHGGELHASIFPEATLSIDSKAANLWHTTQDGVYVAAGVGGPITGRGAHLLLIDDPVKSREEAESATYRERTYDWYQNDAYTRLMPGGRIIVISTRWHEDDLVGRLLRDQEKGGDKWTFLHHPAINANGEALWPARYPVKALHRIRSNVGPRAWQSLYQGDPTPESGTYFSIDSIKRDTMPDIRTMKLYGASDYAVTNDGGDWTVHLVVGMDSEERLWVVDMWRGKTTADRWIPPLIALMKKYDPVFWCEEGGQIEKSVGPFLTRIQRAQKGLDDAPPVHELEGQADPGAQHSGTHRADGAVDTQPRAVRRRRYQRDGEIPAGHA